MACGRVKVFAPSSLQDKSTVFSGAGSFGPPVNQEANTLPLAVRSNPGIPCHDRFAIVSVICVPPELA